jgi:hypothetical protein
MLYPLLPWEKGAGEMRSGDLRRGLGDEVDYIREGKEGVGWENLKFILKTFRL